MEMCAVALLSYVSSLWSQLRCKISPLVLCEILEHIVNILNADNKYSLRNSLKLWQPI